MRFSKNANRRLTSVDQIHKRLMNTTATTPSDLSARHHWLFDMDGTLTLAMHDFDAMRSALELPAGVPILEALDALPVKDAQRKRHALDAMELEMAHQAREQPGAADLLSSLAERGATLGIVTRNGKEIAHATLQACGLSDYFTADNVISRDCAVAKPEPDGIQLLLARWGALPSTAVMVGDYRFDLDAGIRAGCATVHINVDDGERWPDLTDHLVTSLEELRQLALAS